MKEGYEVKQEEPKEIDEVVVDNQKEDEPALREAIELDSTLIRNFNFLKKFVTREDVDINQAVDASFDMARSFIKRKEKIGNTVAGEELETLESLEAMVREHPNPESVQKVIDTLLQFSPEYATGFKHEVNEGLATIVSDIEQKIISPIKQAIETRVKTLSEKARLEVLYEEAQDIRDSAISLGMSVKKQGCYDFSYQIGSEAIKIRLETLADKVDQAVKEILEERKDVTYKDKEDARDKKELAQFAILGEEFEGTPTISDIKSKVEEKVNECAELMGSMESVSPEETARWYADFYMPIIENIRVSETYSDIDKSLAPLMIETLSMRFGEIIETRNMFGFKKEKQVGNGNFPEFAQEVKKVFELKELIRYISKLDSIN